MTWEITIITDDAIRKVEVLLADDGTLADAIEEALEYMDWGCDVPVAILASPLDESYQTFAKDRPENGEVR
tara:strand:+ start:4006 stop:4218 length:213 start_codon:yes stop_codon:yes gene_type:complete